MHELILLLGISEELLPVLHLDKDQLHVFWKSFGYEQDSTTLLANLYEDNSGLLG